VAISRRELGGQKRGAVGGEIETPNDSRGEEWGGSIPSPFPFLSPRLLRRLYLATSVCKCDLWGVTITADPQDT